MIGRSASALKPPPRRARSAPWLAAATTEGSSTAIGMSRSRPFMRKLVAMPTGKEKLPIAFSIIASDRAASSPRSKPIISSRSMPQKRATTPRRSAALSR